jgi:hypothetical protein
MIAGAMRVAEAMAWMTGPFFILLAVTGVAEYRERHRVRPVPRRELERINGRL